MGFISGSDDLADDVSVVASDDGVGGQDGSHPADVVEDKRGGLKEVPENSVGKWLQFPHVHSLRVCGERSSSNVNDDGLNSRVDFGEGETSGLLERGGCGVESLDGVDLSALESKISNLEPSDASGASALVESAREGLELGKDSGEIDGLRGIRVSETLEGDSVIFEAGSPGFSSVDATGEVGAAGNDQSVGVADGQSSAIEGVGVGTSNMGANGVSPVEIASDAQAAFNISSSWANNVDIS